MVKYAVSVTSHITGKTIDPMLIIDADGIQKLRVKLIRKYPEMSVRADIWTCDGRWGTWKFGTPIAQMSIEPSTGYFWHPAGKKYAYRVEKTTGRIYHKLKTDTRWY